MIMPFKKWFASASANKKTTVTVQTKKMPDTDCCASKKDSHCSYTWIFMILLLILNVLLTFMVLYQQRNIESMRVGGMQNYKLLRKVFESEGFKNHQKQQIQQALQMYQVPISNDTSSNK